MKQTKSIDGKMLAKLVSLLDSPIDGEAASAFQRIRELLAKSGVKFYEAVETQEYKQVLWKVFGHPECLKAYFEKAGGNDAALRAELENERTLRMEAEAGGAKIAREFTAANDGLRKQLEQERQLRMDAEAAAVRLTHEFTVSNSALQAEIARLRATRSANPPPATPGNETSVVWKAVQLTAAVVTLLFMIGAIGC